MNVPPGTRTAVQRGVKLASAAVDTVVPPGPGVVVLAYHQVGGPVPGSVNLPPPLFEEQVARLATGDLRPSTLDDAVEALDRVEPEPGPRRVVVTFDDGTADFVDVALPVLVAHRVPVTLYLATGHVEGGTSFWDDGTVLSWSALADAVSTGLVTVGSHTHSHLLLDRATPEAAAEDLDRSIDLIGERLGVTARHLAYPKALPASGAVAAEVAARFRSAAVAGSRPNRYGGTDPQRLARTPIQAPDGMRWFERKVHGGMRLEGALRAVADRRRYAGAER